MLETPHVFVGAAIATKIPNPWVAIPLAFASHFVLEMIPHWNPHLNTETEKFGHITRRSTAITAVDSTFALIAGSFMAYQALPDWKHALTIFFACFAAVLPDVMESPYFFLNWKWKIIEKWITFQKSIQNDVSVVPGLITQLLTILGVIFWIK